MSNPDALSDALVAALQAAAPVGALVIDHDALPTKAEDLPALGLFGLFLFEDRPEAEDGLTDSVSRHPRIATFKVEIRVPKTDHLLHGSRAARKVVEQAVQADPTLGRLARDARLGALRILVHEQNSSIACCAVDVHVDYTYDPETT